MMGRRGRCGGFGGEILLFGEGLVSGGSIVREKGRVRKGGRE
jgi:hypothetical protein